MKKQVSWLKFKINGADFDGPVEESRTLLDLLRENLNLTGTKRGCDMGDCGCCSVLLDGRPVLACLLPLSEVHGCEVRTIEGIATGTLLHPLQEAMMEEGAIQCGYCTPSMVINGVHLLEKNSSPSDLEIKTAVAGTICRCTGYTKIEKAYRKAAEKIRGGG